MGSSFFFSSCFQDGTNFPVFLDVSDGSALSTRVSALPRQALSVTLPRQALSVTNGGSLLLNDWQDAIQRHSAEWTGRYDSANQNCAVRNFSVVKSLDPDFVVTDTVKEFVSQNLAALLCVLDATAAST